jgi:hypothetical protein
MPRTQAAKSTNEVRIPRSAQNETAQNAAEPANAIPMISAGSALSHSRRLTRTAPGRTKAAAARMPPTGFTRRER